MNIIGIIPARMASSRFPGKPLAEICGIPMVGHVYIRSKMCKSLTEVYVATCDKEIAKYVSYIGGKVIMTAKTHERASDRTKEAMVKIENKSGSKVDICVMIQGDEPMIRPKMVEEAIRPILNDESIKVVNLMATVKSKREHEDPDTIKVVVDRDNFALYFSREPIPSRRRGFDRTPLLYKQVCIIPFRRDFLIKFNRLHFAPLEITESIDMLRILEHGYKVKMVLTKCNTYSVDTIEDLKRVENLMRRDLLMSNYRIREGLL